MEWVLSDLGCKIATGGVYIVYTPNTSALS